MDYKRIAVVECNQGAVRKARFNVDGVYCLTCGSDKSIKLWNPHRKLFLANYSGHGDQVLDARGSCDSSRLVSGGHDKCLILWDVATRKPLRRIRAHEARINAVAFNEESTMAGSCSGDNSIRLWDLESRSNSAVQTLREATDAVTCLRLTDHEIVSGSLDGGVRLYDIRVGRLITDWLGDPVTCLSLTGDGQCFVTSTSDSSVHLVDKSTGGILSTYTGHNSADYLVESSIDTTDSIVVSGSTDGFLYCWDLVKAVVIDKLAHDLNTAVHSVSAHPTNKFLLTATATRFYLWGEEALASEDL